MGPTTRLPDCRPLSLSQATPAFKSLEAGCGKQTTEAGCLFCYSKSFVLCFCGVSFFFLGLKVCGILIPRPVIEPTSPCFGRQSLNQWTPGKSLKALFKAQAFRCPSLLEAGFHLPFLLSASGLGRTYWKIWMCEAAVTSTAQNP